jgi:hypothetical protein
MGILSGDLACCRIRIDGRKVGEESLDLFGFTGSGTGIDLYQIQVKSYTQKLISARICEFLMICID